MHCYLMQWLHGCFHTEHFLLLFTESVLFLIIEVLCFDWFFLKLAVPALRRGEYSQDDNFIADEWSPLSRSEQHISSSPSVVTPVHLRLWCTSPLATEKQWLSIILPATLQNIICLLWNEVKFYLLHKARRQGRWHRTELQSFSPQHPRCSLNSMASAHKWRLII